MTIDATGPTRIGEATIAEFAAGLRGTAVRPGDADYDRERSIWNGAHDRHPALIARCAGVADVIRTVDLARSEGLPLAVRGGGHSIPGFSTVDDGIVLDLSLMKGVQVDPARRRVTAQAGCTWKDVDAETQQFGLAVTGGLVSSTGIAGFTTGGGIGWLVRKHGLASDNLVGADVVTADGQFVHASADENPRSVLGAARRRRQFRCGDVLRVPIARGRADRSFPASSSTRPKRRSRCCAATAPPARRPRTS